MSWAEHFDALAPTYDEFTASTGWHANDALLGMLERHDVRAESILDVGAGTGQTATTLRSRYPGADLVLAEPSVEMARLAAVLHPGARVMTVEADALLGAPDPVLGPAAYDLITGIGVLELLPDPAATVARAANSLAPGGHLAVTYEQLLATSAIQGEPVTRLSGGRTVTRMTPHDLRSAAEGAGLVRVDSEEFVAYQRGDTREDVRYELVLWRAPGRTGSSSR